MHRVEHTLQHGERAFTGQVWARHQVRGGSMREATTLVAFMFPVGVPLAVDLSGFTVLTS